MGQGFAGRAVIVTGAARGVGLAVARAFVKAGASVMLADMDESRLEIAVRALTEEGLEGQAQPFFGDLRQKLAMTNLAAATLDAFDGIDILVNASRLLVPSEPLKAEADRLEETLQQNVAANLRLTQIVARRMMEIAAEEETPADRSILNMSSVQAHRANPRLLAYSVSCAAVEQLTRILAVALAPSRIRVNAIAAGGLPGHSLAEALPEVEDLAEAMASVVPLGRAATPEDAAAAALYLAAPAAGFVTGQVLAIDGGRHLVDPLLTGRT